MWLPGATPLSGLFARCLPYRLQDVPGCSFTDLTVPRKSGDESLVHGAVFVRASFGESDAHTVLPRDLCDLFLYASARVVWPLCVRKLHFAVRFGDVGVRVTETEADLSTGILFDPDGEDTHTQVLVDDDRLDGTGLSSRRETVKLKSFRRGDSQVRTSTHTADTGNDIANVVVGKRNYDGKGSIGGLERQGRVLT